MKKMKSMLSPTLSHFMLSLMKPKKRVKILKTEKISVLHFFPFDSQHVLLAADKISDNNLISMSILKCKTQHKTKHKTKRFKNEKIKFIKPRSKLNEYKI